MIEMCPLFAIQFQYAIKCDIGTICLSFFPNYIHNENASGTICTSFTETKLIIFVCKWSGANGGD